MSLKTPFVFALAASAALVSTSALAGGDCRGSRCYQLVTTPAEYSTVSEQVQVKAARTVARYVPAEYGTVEEPVTLQFERTIAHRVPAVTKTVSEQVLISPARKAWQTSRDAHGNITGCWVKIPAQYGVQTRTVVVQEASVRYETIPAVQGVRTRKVLVKPATVVHETIPAVYQTQHRTVLTRPASRAWQPLGAGF